MKIQFSKQEKIDITETASSWTVAFMMCVYGFSKIAQFNGAIQVEKSLPELTGMELMWAFYGYSLTFALIIGTIEITAAILLFFKRTRIIGCLLITTILVNIIIQDIVFEVHKGALSNAITYQILILVILWMNRIKILDALKILTTIPKSNTSLKKTILKYTITIIFFILISALPYFLHFCLKYFIY